PGETRSPDAVAAASATATCYLAHMNVSPFTDVSHSVSRLRLSGRGVLGSGVPRILGSAVRGARRAAPSRPRSWGGVRLDLVGLRRRVRRRAAVLGLHRVGQVPKRPV